MKHFLMMVAAFVVAGILLGGFILFGVAVVSAEFNPFGDLKEIITKDRGKTSEVKGGGSGVQEQSPSLLENKSPGEGGGVQCGFHFVQTVKIDAAGNILYFARGREPRGVLRKAGNIATVQGQAMLQMLLSTPNSGQLKVKALYPAGYDCRSKNTDTAAQVLWVTRK